MSWSVSTGPVPAPEFRAAITKLTFPETYLPSPETQEQLAAAKQAALSIYQSGALGFAGNFEAGLTGHANPNHEPTTGWAMDGVYVNVHRVVDPRG